MQLSTTADRRIGIAIFVCFALLGLYLRAGVLTTDIQGGHFMRQAATMWNVLNFADYDANILNPRSGTLEYFQDAKIVRLEFPIMQWCIGMLYKIFGDHIIIARSFLWLISLVAMAALGKLVYKKTGSAIGGGLAAAFLQASPLYFFYSINILPDLLAFAASFCYLYFITKYFRGKESGVRRDLHFASFSLLIAFAAKLPYLLISSVSIYFFIAAVISNRFNLKQYVRDALIQLAWIMPAAAWYFWVFPTWGDSGVLHPLSWRDFYDPEIQDILKYHAFHWLPVLFVGEKLWPLVLASVVIIFFSRQRAWLLALLSTILLYYLLEARAISYVHDYYMLPFLLFIFSCLGLLLAYVVRFWSWFAVPLVAFAGYLNVTTYALVAERWTIEHSSMLENVMRNSESLASVVPNPTRAVVISDPTEALFNYRVRKRAFVNAGTGLSEAWLKNMIVEGEARVFYNNVEALSTDSTLAPYFDSLLYSVEDISVFRLKDPEAPDK